MNRSNDNVYQAPSHSTSPYMEVGPALQQALRLARCQASNLKQRKLEELPAENDVMDKDITREEQRLLSANAQVVKALEDLFSWRHKDRTSRTSKLSFVESWRFQRVMYRVWLLSYLYGMGSVPVVPITENCEYSDLMEYQAKQKAFLKQFTTKALHQINRIAIFLQGIANWALFAEGRLIGSLEVYDFKGLYLFAGPHAVLQCYEEMSTEPLQLGYLNDDGPYEKFLTGPLKELYTERQVTNEPYGKDLEKLILDRVNGENDKCRQCTSDYQWLPGIKQGVNLYNETNWDYLRGSIIADLQFHVPGKVLQNQSDKQLYQTLRNIDYAILMDEMFDSKKEPYLNLSKQDWVCYDCLTELFRDTVLRWWLNRKRRDGVTIKEDCQYGYDCSQQTYSRGLEHAMRFNHLCEPTQREQGSQGAY